MDCFFNLKQNKHLSLSLSSLSLSLLSLSLSLSLPTASQPAVWLEADHASVWHAE